jgi:hypothetical protein
MKHMYQYNFFKELTQACLFICSNQKRHLYRLENLSVWQISVFRYGLLMRNQGYIEVERLEKQCWSNLSNIKTAINYFLQIFCT